MRGWSYGRGKEVLAEGKTESHSHGGRSPRRVPIAMGNNSVGSIKAWHDSRETSALGREGRRKIDTRVRAGITTDAKARMRELELENEKLKRANEILGAVSVFNDRKLDGGIRKTRRE